MATITIVDESTMAQKHTWTLDILEESLSLRELIRRRIYQEVTEFNAKQSLYSSDGLRPTPIASRATFCASTSLTLWRRNVAGATSSA